MKIGIISTVMGPYKWAGSEEMWKMLAVTALKAGHSVAVSLYEDFADSDELEEFKKLGGVLFPWSPPSWLRRRMISTGRFGRFRSFQRWEPDVVVTSGPPAGHYRQHDIRFFLDRIKVPEIHIIQGNDPSFISGLQERMDLGRILERAARVVCVSTENLVMLRRQLATPLSRGVVISNPIRTRLDRFLQWPDGDLMRMATVARLEVWSKCQDLTLQALASQEWRDRNWHLSLHGMGPDQPYLQKLIEYYGLKAHVELMGFERDFQKIWASNHLHILNSRAEGIALALIESMFCGRPAVVTRTGGNHEIVRSQVDGWICPGTNVESVAETLEEAWRCREQWQKMGQNAFTRACKWVPVNLESQLLDLVAEPSIFGR